MTTTEAKHRILITVEGGVIQDIENIPPGTVVEVHDFDKDGDRSHPTWSEEHQAYVCVWGETGESVAPGSIEVRSMREALETIARMQMDGEDGFDLTNDDAVDSLHSCIRLARDALV